MMYIRFILALIVNIPLFILGFIYNFFFGFFLKNWVQKFTNKKFKIWIWYFVNSDEVNPNNSDEQNMLNNHYGVYELFTDDDDKPDWEGFAKLGAIRRWVLYVTWNCFRNFSWNARKALGRYFLAGGIPKGYLTPDIYTIIRLEGIASPTTWRNKTIFGVQFITFPFKGKKHFRYSYTKPNWFSNIFGYKYSNFMAGTNQDRFLIKYRWVKNNLKS